MTWRRRWYAWSTALLGGLAAGLAHPPFGLLPGLLGYALILIRIDQPIERPVRSAFALGWFAGLGYFGVSTWWVMEPFLTDVATYGWMAPFAVILMAGGLALFWGAAGAVHRALAPRSVWKVLVFAGVFSAFEWLRGHILTGFPWNLPGETWAAGTAPSQAASLVGAYGLSWITLAIAATPGLIALNVRRVAQAGALALAGISLVALFASGAGRLAADGPPGARVAAGAPRVRIVQANIDQKNKWKAENLDLIVRAYEDLSRRPAKVRPDIVVWPEGALPAVIDDLLLPTSPYAARLAQVIEPGQVLLMGVNRVEPAAGGKWRYYNSLMAFGRENEALRVTAVYDKFRLVPFGEFIPLGDLAGKVGFRSLVHIPDDFTRGPPPRPIRAPGLPSVQPLICYEALFPGLADASTGRPGWILNISNDAWFGQGSGPWQHLNIASYRAIEQGLPIIRSTPTGVSAVIDAHGRLLPHKWLGLGRYGIIDAPLPPPTAPTLYSRIGDWGFAGLLLISAAGWLIGRARKPRPLEGT